MARATGGLPGAGAGAGTYACAIRFVRAATGQATAVVPLGVVEVV